MDRATLDAIMRGEYQFQPHIIDQTKGLPQWKPITPIPQKAAPPTSAGLPVNASGTQQTLPYDRYGYQKLNSVENVPRGSYMDYRNYQEKVNPVRNPPRAMTENDPSIGDMAKATVDAINPLTKVAQLVTFGLNLQAKKGQEADALYQENVEKMKTLSPGEYSRWLMDHPQSMQYDGLLPNLLKDRDPSTKDWITQHWEDNQKKGRELLMNGKSGPEQFFTDAILSSGQMLGDAAISSVTGLPVSVYVGLTGGAQAGQQALDEGYSSDQAAAMMLGSGAISAGIESIGGFGGDLGEAVGKKLLNSGKVPQKIVNYVSKLSGNKLVELLGDAASEGGEEFLEYDLQRLYENLILDKDTPRDIKEQLYNTGIGAFAGGLYGSARQATDFISSQLNKKAGLTDVQPASIPETAEERSPADTARKASLITIDEFKDTENEVWRNIGYGDELAKAQITNQVANDMLRANEYVELKSEDLEKFSPYFPDLRSQKKADRIPVIRQKTAEVEARLEAQKQTGLPQAVGADGGRGTGLLGTSTHANIFGVEAVRESLGDGFDAVREGGITRVETPKKRAAYEFREATVGAEKDSKSTSSKAERIQKRMERNFIEKMSRALSIPAQAKRERITPAVAVVFNSLKQNGKLTNSEADMLFDVIYRSGVRTVDEYYTQYKPLRDELKNTKLQISREDSANIADFPKFRKENFGTLRIVRDNGIPVDSKYIELQERYPELFPEDITHPADQLQRISEVAKGIRKTEVSLDQYHGPDAEMYRRFAREEFDRAVDELSQQARQVKAYEDEQAEKYKHQNETPVTLEQAKEAYQSKKELSQKAERVVAGTLLTERDNVFVELLLKGEITPNEIPAGTNKADILKVYSAKKAAKEASDIVDRYKKQRREENRKLAEHMLENSDSWKEKKNGFAYERETMERNFRDIIPDAEEAERMVDAYITPIHKSEAQSTRMKNGYRDRIRNLNLSTKNKYKIQVALGSLTNNQAKTVKKATPGLPYLLDVSESGLVQLYGEKKVTEQQIRNCGADFEKISRATQEFRNIYDELLNHANDVLMKNGYDPIERRKDYFPHFTDDSADSLLGKVAAKLGMEIQKDELPTSLSGITDSFRPGKRWMPNALRRIGTATEYDALKGFDRYLEGASDIIYHTDNIQRLRALEDEIRYKYSDEGIKAEVDEVRENPTLSAEQKRGAMEEAYKRSTTKFPYLVRELRTYTNILAGKKHPGDREIEHAVGRCIYNAVKAVEGRAGANMVALNPGSALTNFIPLTQALSGVKTKNLLAGLRDTVKSYGTDDGYVAKSDFLTNRKGTDLLSKTGLERAADMASLPMQIIDDITSGTISRARYYENIENGMTEDAAIADSDKFTAGLMADRSKGATPTLFNKRNLVTKLFTMFQLETNNQISYNLKDVPRDKKDKGALAIVAALTKMFIGAYLFNELYEKLTGRRAALDPIGIVEDAVGDFTDKDVKNSQAIANLGKNVAEEIPFVGGLIGGGRLPISSALPDITKLPKVFDSSVDGKKKAEILLKEGAKPAFYLLPPFGGGQLKKIVEGTETVAAGGSYTYNNEGEKQLQFPVFDRSPLAYAQAATFGKYALPTAQDYVDGGFRPFTSKQTAVYDTLTNEGADARRVYQTLLDLQQAEAVKDMYGKTYKSKAEVQREKLSKEILTPSQKKYIDESLINDFMVIPQESDVDYSSDETFVISQLSKNQQEGFAKAKASGVDADTYAEVLKNAGKLEGDKDVHGDTIPGSKKKKVSEYINSLPFTYAQRMALMEALGYQV